MRECYSCGSIVTQGSWYLNRDIDENVLCKRCYTKYFSNPMTSKKRNMKWNPINNPNHLYFKGKHVVMKFNPRKGLCQWCGAVKGLSCKLTVMHHLEYHGSEPLKDTIELCVSCHRKEHIRINVLNCNR